jgi:hypothetical protein
MDASHTFDEPGGGTFFTKIDRVPITFNVLAATAARPRALSELNP